jgi:hypothetical protein
LHPLPAVAFTGAFGVTRTVGLDTPMVSFALGQYSVPHQLAGQTVWVRRHGERIVIVHVGAHGPVEVARHQQTSPGSLGSTTRISRRPRPARWPAPPARTPAPRRRSWPSGTARSCG